MPAALAIPNSVPGDVTLSPGSSARNAVQPIADAIALAAVEAAAGQTQPVFQVLDNAEGGLLTVFPPGQGIAVQINPTIANDIALVAYGAANGLQDICWLGNFNGNRRYVFEAATALAFWQATNGNAEVRVGKLTASWANPVDVNRQGRVVLTVEDAHGVREVFRAEADGTNPRIGLLGAAAVARVTLPAAATDLASAVTLINAIRAALISVGIAQ